MVSTITERVLPLMPRTVVDMEILGLVFAGTATHQRGPMARFVEEALGLQRVQSGGMDADMFELPDGAHFAVAGERHQGGGTSRTIGFRVVDLERAIAELRSASVQVCEPHDSDRHRYAHFTAPDGELYELIQER